MRDGNVRFCKIPGDPSPDVHISTTCSRPVPRSLTRLALAERGVSESEVLWYSLPCGRGSASRPLWVSPMVPKIDHYVPLLRAVASLDRTSYEAPGAIYDSALASMMERLGATVP